MGPRTIEDLLELQGGMDPGEWRVRSDAAQVVANYLVCHPRVVEVRYPGLKSDPDFGRAANTLRGGFGPCLSYRVAGEPGWQEFIADDSDARGQVLTLEAALA